MITITRKITLNGVALPVNYTFDLPDSCVNITDTSITDNIISVTLTFTDNDCIEFNNTIKLNLEDANGCKRIFNITLANPCANFTTTGIEAGPQFSFRIPIVGGRGPLTYNWTFDTNLFELDRQISNLLFLTPIGEFSADEVTTIGVTVTDSNGCVLEETFDYTICGPEFDLDTIQTACQGATRSTGRFFIDANSCGAVIDWSTLIIDVPNGVEVENQGDGFVIITFDDNYPEGQVTFPISVETFDGVFGSGTITINVVDCSRAPDVLAFAFNFECEACQESDRQDEDIFQCFGPLTIHLPDLIVGLDPIDWSTFTFIQGPNQVLVGPFEIFTEFGHAIFNANQDVVYSPNVDLTFETIVWNVDTEDGETLTGILTFTHDFCGEAPQAVDDNFCVSCGETLGPVNLLANDLGDIDPSTFVFLGPFPSPDQGVLTIFPNGIIQFVPNVNFNGTYTFQYRVSNFEGLQSNIATVTIDINCIDETEFEISLCMSDGVVNLWETIDSQNTDSYWEFVGYSEEQDGELEGATFSVNMLAPQFYEPGQQITTSHLATVDLTNSPAGFYQFLYTGGLCVPDVLVTIEVVESEELEDQTINVCITQGSVNLDLLIPDLPEGEWTFSGEGFVDPIYTFTEPGVFEFHYIVDNGGVFNEVCNSNFTLTLVVEELGFNPGLVEITVCTNDVDS